MHVFLLKCYFMLYLLHFSFVISKFAMKLNINEGTFGRLCNRKATLYLHFFIEPSLELQGVKG